MQSLLRAINIVLSPALTLFFASRFQGLTLGGRDASDIAGATVAGLLVLMIEIALNEGPKRSQWVRRWLDPRAAFEGVWLQDVSDGQPDNALGVFSLDYAPESDSFVIDGYAYSERGKPFAKWTSTHMFIDAGKLTAMYRWEGGLLGDEPTPDSEKAGLTALKLRRAPVFARPMIGDGSVGHVGEVTRVTFDLRRVTDAFLDELGLPFSVRQLRLNDHGEEAQLVQVFLHRRNERKASERPMNIA